MMSGGARPVRWAVSTSRHTWAPRRPPLAHLGSTVEAKKKPPAWMPTAIDDDRTLTIVVFPQAMMADEAAVLSVMGSDGTAQLVNYCVHGQVYLVDRRFQRAELRVRVGKREVVRMTGTRDSQAVTCPGAPHALLISTLGHLP
jgi:type IV secretory pathway VirB9-like protein